MTETTTTTDNKQVASPYEKAPAVTANLYVEAMPTLYASNAMYNLCIVIDKTREKTMTLDTSVLANDGIKDLDRFLTDGESADLTEYNDGNGLSFANIQKLVENNENQLRENVKDDFFKSVYSDLQAALSVKNDDNNSTGNGNAAVYLTHYRSIQQKVACVYGIFKDTRQKNIIVAFRGSTAPGTFSSRDWSTNLNARVSGMRTPKKIRDPMGMIDKSLGEKVLVHLGFFNYLFDNEKMKDGEQRYDTIVKDIRGAINKESGYRVYVTGHSLGGALATMFSTTLAGAGSSFDDIPRPLTCITWAAPFSGTAGYQSAIEQLEKNGLLRSLRINNGEDLVPTLPPWSLLRKRLMKHAGMYLRLTRKGHHIEHTSKQSFASGLRNSVFKPVWRLAKWHSLRLHSDRFERDEKTLSSLMLDDLYRDESYVDKSFKDQMTNL